MASQPTGIMAGGGNRPTGGALFPSRGPPVRAPVEDISAEYLDEEWKKLPMGISYTDFKKVMAEKEKEIIAGIMK